MPSVPRGELRFLIHHDSLHVNLHETNTSPVHIAYAYLLGIVSREIAQQIVFSEVDSQPDVASKLLGQALLGGYCTKISDEPLRFKYTHQSTTVVPASKTQFDTVQASGKIVFEDFADKDIYATDLYLR